MSIVASAAEGLQNGIQIQSMSSEWEIQNKWSWCVLNCFEMSISYWYISKSTLKHHKKIMEVNWYIIFYKKHEIKKEASSTRG